MSREHEEQQYEHFSPLPRFSYILETASICYSAALSFSEGATSALIAFTSAVAYPLYITFREEKNSSALENKLNNSQNNR